MSSPEPAGDVAGLPLSVAHRCLPLHPGEPCGDAAAALPFPGGLLLALLDGLGHGEPAARAAGRALQVLRAAPGEPLPALLAQLDAQLRDTRGAAVALVRLGPGPELTAAGVGNVAMLHGQGGRFGSLPSQAGFLGGRPGAKWLQHTRPWATGDCLLMHTDGVAGPLPLGLLLPEWRRAPELLCEHLLARHRRPGDDAGVLVCHGGPVPQDGRP